MNNKPLISVITTVYNCEKYVNLAIQSILDQTYDNFEFIIINDGSTDSTWDIVTSYDDDRIIAIDNSDNKGISCRRNEAVEKSSGKYIAIQDGDDISLPKRLEYQSKIMEGKESIFCIGSWATKIDHDGNKIGNMTYPPVSHSSIVKMFCGPTNPMIDPTTMMRKKDFIELGGYSSDKRTRLVPDYDLWTRAVMKEKLFYNLSVPMVQYRVNPQGNTLKHNQNMIREHVYVMMKLIKFLRER